MADQAPADNDEAVAAEPPPAEAAEAVVQEGVHNVEDNVDEDESDDDEEEDDEEDDDDEEFFGELLIPPTPLSLDDPRRMDLTEEEREWALAIKQAIEEDGTGNLEPLNDYWYGQIALVDESEVPAALDRIHHMQIFRQEYDIQDTVAQGQQVIRKYMKYFPGFYLSLSYNNDGGNYTLVFDAAKFYTSVLKENPDAYTTWFQAIYYINHALCPDMEAIRRGMVMLWECSDFEWKKNFGLEVMRPYWADIAAVYPLNHHRIKAFHTGVLFNTFVSMAKKFMPAEARDLIEVGCICPLGRLSDLYLSPSLEAAHQRFVARFTSSLQLRYKNEASFSLSG